MRIFFADIIQFFRKEPAYGVLFSLLLFFFSAMFLFTQPQPEMMPPSSSQSVDALQNLESEFQERARGNQVYRELARDHPETLYAYMAFLLILGIGFFYGLYLNLVQLPRKSFRDSLEVPGAHFDGSSIGHLIKVLTLLFTILFILGSVSGALMGMAERDLSVNVVMITHTLITDFLILLLIYYVLDQDKIKMAFVGVLKPAKSLIHEIGVGISGYLSVLPFFVLSLAVMMFISSLFAYEPPPHPLVNVLLEEEKQAGWVFYTSIFLATFVGPIIEEIFFRGFCYSIFKRYWGTWISMVLASLLFAAVHNSGFAFFPIFILGMALNYVFEKRKSIVASCVMHLTHNTVFLIYFFLVKDLMAKGVGAG